MCSYMTVARITVPPQTSWSEARSKVGNDQLVFSPWHGLPRTGLPAGSCGRDARPERLP